MIVCLWVFFTLQDVLIGVLLGNTVKGYFKHKGCHAVFTVQYVQYVFFISSYRGNKVFPLVMSGLTNIQILCSSKW